MSFHEVPGVLVWPLRSNTDLIKNQVLSRFCRLSGGNNIWNRFGEEWWGWAEVGWVGDGYWRGSCCWDVGFDTVTTNLRSFVSFVKTQKLHRAIDHRLAGVTWQAHFALDGVTKEDTAVQSGHGDDGENKEVNKNSHEGTARGEGGGRWGRPWVWSDGEEAGLTDEWGMESESLKWETVGRLDSEHQQGSKVEINLSRSRPGEIGTNLFSSLLFFLLSCNVCWNHCSSSSLFWAPPFTHKPSHLDTCDSVCAHVKWRCYIFRSYPSLAVLPYLLCR